MLKIAPFTKRSETAAFSGLQPVFKTACSLFLIMGRLLLSLSVPLECIAVNSLHGPLGVFPTMVTHDCNPWLIKSAGSESAEKKDQLYSK